MAVASGKGRSPWRSFTKYLRKRDDEHNPQESADGAGQERLPPMHVEPVDVESRDDERGAGGDHAGRLADGLHDDVFEDRALAAAASAPCRPKKMAMMAMGMAASMALPARRAM